MTAERWRTFTMERQILMVGTEFARAKALLRSGAESQVTECYGRALELLDLCTGDARWRRRLRELLRFREILGELYLEPVHDPARCMLFYRVLMTWSGETARVEL